MDASTGSQLVSFISTLFATLIGVYIAFWLERQAKNRDRRQTNLNSLLALRSEIQRNKGIAVGNHSTVAQQAGSDPDVDHYSIDMYNIDAWDSAVQNNILSQIDPDLHESIQQVYSQIKSTNELIKRLRVEPLHDQLEENPNDNPYGLEPWTIRVSYWDEQEQKVMESGLGNLIGDRSNRIKIKLESVEDQLDHEINRLKLKMGNEKSNESPF